MAAAATKAKHEQKIVIALAAVFLVFFANSLNRLGVFGRRTGQATPRPAASARLLPEMIKGHLTQLEALPDEAAAAGAVPRVSDPPVGYAAMDLRDPMASLLPQPAQELAPMEPTEPIAVMEPAAPPPPPPFLEVQGILWGGAQPQALINGTLYRVGSEVEGALIRAITRSGVTIEYGGDQIAEIGVTAEASAARMSRPRYQGGR